MLREHQEIHQGVSLADESNLKKAFPPVGRENMLGVTYDLENLMWTMDEGECSVLVSEFFRLKKKNYHKGRGDPYGQA